MIVADKIYVKVLGQAASLMSDVSSSLPSHISDEISIIDVSSPLPKGLDPRKIIILSDRLEPADVIEQAAQKGVRHIVQKGHGNLETEIRIAAEMMTNLDSFLKNTVKTFGIQGKELIIDFNSIQQKEEVKQKIFNHIQPIPPLRTLADAVLLIADEMIMNAMFDAPGNLNRTKDVLPDGKMARVLLTYDKKQLIVACEDPFGSIEDAKLMKRLKACYTGDQVTDINFGPGGAGIGCRMMFDNSTAMYFAAKKNVKTITCCQLPVDQGLKATLTMPKNLHIAI